MAIDVGSLYRATYDVTDANGALTNATTITLTITLPDQTITSPSVTNPPATTGKYLVDYATVQAGLHRFHWVTTGPTTTKDDWVNVRSFVSILSLDQARDYLGQQDKSKDEKIRSLMASTTKLIENKIGACVVRQITEERNGHWRLKVLNRPVVSVASVTSIYTNGPSWVTADLATNLNMGVIRLKSRASFYDGPFNVTYTAGRPDLSDDIQEAAERALWHAWATQRGITADSNIPELTDVSDYERAIPIAGGAHALPWHVEELLTPYALVTGYA